MKAAAGRLPLGEALFLRGVVAMTLVGLIAWRTGVLGVASRMLHRPLIWRTVADAGASFFFVAALGRMPLADVAAIMQTNPLAVTAGAALFLGERVGWRRWSATGIGFLGVLLIVQPGSSAFTWASLLVMIAVFAAAARDIVSRHLAGIPVVLITAGAVTFTTVLSAALFSIEAWHALDWGDLLRASGAAVFMITGQVLLLLSIRTGDMSAVVPFRYSAILWSLLLSLIFWHYVPDASTLIGIVIVCAAGLYTIFREQQLGRQGRMG